MRTRGRKARRSYNVHDAGDDVDPVVRDILVDLCRGRRQTEISRMLGTGPSGLSKIIHGYRGFPKNLRVVLLKKISGGEFQVPRRSLIYLFRKWPEEAMRCRIKINFLVDSVILFVFLHVSEKILEKDASEDQSLLTFAPSYDQAGVDNSADLWHAEIVGFTLKEGRSISDAFSLSLIGSELVMSIAFLKADYATDISIRALSLKSDLDFFFRVCKRFLLLRRIWRTSSRGILGPYLEEMEIAFPFLCNNPEFSMIKKDPHSLNLLIEPNLYLLSLLNNKNIYN
ncbi:MAG TPA: hypothetical protein VMD74_01335 [Candidatus Methylomirabilis sp.]|nr:hypothetical protein [Candidatus Methylomirabilis sp.]